MKQNITITLDAETMKLLKEEAKRQNKSIKQLGEELFVKMVEEEKAKEENITNTL